jgi:hypothetical protein
VMSTNPPTAPRTACAGDRTGNHATPGPDAIAEGARTLINSAMMSSIGLSSAERYLAGLVEVATATMDDENPPPEFVSALVTEHFVPRAYRVRASPALGLRNAATV